MDVEVNWESDDDTDDDTGAIREDHPDDSSCPSEWLGRNASLQLEAQEDYLPPFSPDTSPAGPSGQQELPVELNCEEEETRTTNCQWTNSATAQVFITSSTNFDLQCEDEDPELRLPGHAKRAVRRMSEDHNDIVITDSCDDEEDLAPMAEDILPHHCKKCGETFHDLNRLKEHQQCHNAECSYRCPICSKEFFRMANLRMHRLIHSSDRPYKCSECDKGFFHKVDFWRHLRNVHKIEHLQALRNVSLVKGSSVHQNQNVSSQVCPRDPGREHPKPYLCPICGKGFRTSNLLSKHKVIHRQDKPYECQECGKAFVQLLRLKRHQKIHTGERPFYCQECGGTFTRLTSLHRHQRIHTGEKPYSCAYCAQDFTESGSLRRHERIHQMKMT